MPVQLFNAGNLNVAGICHAICCQWVNQSRRLGNVTTLQGLGNPAAMFMNWQLPANWQGINANYHLPANNVVNRPQFQRHWVAQQATLLNGYALIIMWGGGLNAAGAHNIQGHTVAVRKTPATAAQPAAQGVPAVPAQPTRIQYFDPNEGAFEFANSLELSDWLQVVNQVGGVGLDPYTAYPGLRNRLCEVVTV